MPAELPLAFWRIHQRQSVTLRYPECCPKLLATAMQHCSCWHYCWPCQRERKASTQTIWRAPMSVPVNCFRATWLRASAKRFSCAFWTRSTTKWSARSVDRAAQMWACSRRRQLSMSMWPLRVFDMYRSYVYSDVRFAVGRACSRVSAWPGHPCGIRVENAKTADAGHWRLTSSRPGNLTRGYSFVTVQGNIPDNSRDLDVNKITSGDLYKPKNFIIFIL